MHASRSTALAVALIAAGCHSYSPDVVDPAAHAREFAARVPDANVLRDFAARLQQAAPSPQPFDLADGLDLGEARLVALLWNPALRTLRLRAEVAAAAAEHAGRWADPELSLDFVRILEDVGHPWLVGGAAAITLPITGRPGLEQALAQSQHAHVLLQARLAEAHVLHDLEIAWVRASAARLAVDLLRGLVQHLAELERIGGRLAAAQLITAVEARAFALERTARQLQLLAAEAAVATAELAVLQLLGMPPDRALRLVPAMDLPLQVPDAGERRAALPVSPRVALAAAEHAVADREFALAIRRQWPELSLLPGLQEEDAQPRVALGLSLPLPLWNRNARQVAEARAERARAAEALRASVEIAAQELAIAEVRQAAALGQRRLVEAELVPLAAQQLADARRLAEVGVLDTLLILDALGRSHQAQTLAIEAAVAAVEATVAVNSLFWPSLLGVATEAAR